MTLATLVLPFGVLVPDNRRVTRTAKGRVLLTTRYREGKRERMGCESRHSTTLDAVTTGARRRSSKVNQASAPSQASELRCSIMPLKCGTSAAKRR